MTINDFLELVAKMMEAQAATTAIANAKGQSGLTKEEKEQFWELFAIESMVKYWLPKFRSGLNCRNCVEGGECDDEFCTSCFRPK